MNKCVNYFVFITFTAVIGLALSGCISLGSGSSISIRTQNNVSTVLKGGTLSCSASGRDIHWTVSSTSDGAGPVANGTAIYDDGTLVISNNESLLSVYIIATSAQNGATAFKQIRIVTVTGVTISSPAQSVALGRTLQFRAQVSGTNAPDNSVIWNVSSSASGTGYITSGTGINTNGLLTVSANETNRTLYITGTSIVDPSKSSSVSVSIVVPTVTNVTVTPANGNVKAGSAIQFSSSVTGTNSPVTTVTWEVSSNQSGTGTVAPGTRISASGQLTVASSETFTILYVTATSTFDTTKFSRVSVSVVIPTITRISVGPTDQALKAGNSLNFYATVDGTNNPDTSVTWKVSSNAAGNGPVVSGTVVSASGRLTVSSSETARILYVFATSVFDPSKSAYAVVIIDPATTTTTPATTTPTNPTNPTTRPTRPTTTPPTTTTPTTTTPTTTTPTTTTPTTTATVTSVTVSPLIASTQTNSYVQFNASVTGTNNPATGVTWRVGPNSDGTGSVATNTTVNTSGRLRVAPNEWNPTLYVVATSTADTSKRGAAVVTITNNNANQGSNQGQGN